MLLKIYKLFIKYLILKYELVQMGHIFNTKFKYLNFKLNVNFNY